MKSTDKFVLVLVASLFLLIAGCGGGGSSSSGGDMMTGGGGGTTPPPAATCPEGQVGTPPDDCMVPGPTEEEIVALTNAAASKKEKIEEEAAQTTDAGIGGDGTPAADATNQVEGSYNLNIEYGETSIVKEAAAANNNERFTQAMDLGGGTTMHVLTMDADNEGDVVEEVVIVSTDIEAPKATAFAMVAGQTLDVTTDTTNDSPSQTNEALDVDQTSEDVRALVMSPAFTANTAAVLTFTGDDTSTTDEDEAFEAAGTYNGAMGTYRCNDNAACTVTLDAMGKITEMTDGWIFTPDEGATSDVSDSDYLYYGFWLQRTTDGDGVRTYDEVETFAGSFVDPSGDVSAVLGRATYSGGATGVYVHEVHNPAGNIDSATSGHFTADVMLTATFAQTTENDIPPNLLNTLSGTIRNFMLSGHDTGPGWSLHLQGAIAAGAVADGGVGTAPNRDSDGSFTATFHGSVADDGDSETPIPFPSSVVGEFGAVFSNGSVAGAFGATEDD